MCGLVFFLAMYMYVHFLAWPKFGKKFLLRVFFFKDVMKGLKIWLPFFSLNVAFFPNVTHVNEFVK